MFRRSFLSLLSSIPFLRLAKPVVEPVTYSAGNGLVIGGDGTFRTIGFRWRPDAPPHERLEQFVDGESIGFATPPDDLKNVEVMPGMRITLGDEELAGEMGLVDPYTGDWLRLANLDGGSPPTPTVDETIAWVQRSEDEFRRDFQEHNHRWMEEYLWGELNR